MKLFRMLRCGLLNHGKRRVIIGLAVVLVFSSLISLLGTREPTYRGRTLTSWLTQCHETPLMEAQRLEEAQKAVRAMKANKVTPILFKMAAAGDGPVRSWMIEESDKWNIPFLKKMRSAEDIQQLAIAGFEALGTEAAPAVEELTRLLGDPAHAFTAVRCLAAIGEPADLPLLEDRSDHVSSWAAKSLADFGANAASAFPALSNLLESGTAATTNAPIRTSLQPAPVK